MSARGTYHRNGNQEQHYRVLAHLQNGGDPSIAGIADGLHIHKATVRVAIQRLQLEGYIVTGQILQDFVVVLTDDGAEWKAPADAQPEALLPCGHSKAAFDRLGFCLPCRQEERREYCKKTQYLPTLRVQMRG